MTQPPQPLPTNGAPNYFKLSLSTRTAETGLELPVSHGAVGSATAPWTGIPWDVETYDPLGQHSTNGWTILNGPCLFSITVWLKTMKGDAGASIHLMPRVAKRINGVNVIQRSLEAREHFIGQEETHPQNGGAATYSNTHIDGAWIDTLAEDERLQLFLDHWNSAESASIVGGTVTGVYWPRPWDGETP